MKKQRVVSHSTKVNELTFDDLYEEISKNWQDKAERLQARRWHRLKHEIKGSIY